MGRLLLVRHGQASFGAADYDCLSELGHRQCVRLGQYLRERGARFEAVVTGTLKRHAQSWQGIAEGMQVRQDAQRKGAGRALIAAVVDEARARRLPEVTLTTFRDIPWNAPFYARCWFVEIPEAEFGEFLRLVRTKETEIGLDVANRCAMRLTL